ncbi:hypothetical protein BIW11_14121 [Tropilaelaps mercedesae]|uniref:Uncharacterized protein n=1 Tax=Tropilaelaps mercedesae TaxID=418985 RepID=A0A1V9WYZ8_9ACAR|nr:hypothetical protein BIW11_14121 [Tropilaelaps mercedesae]
MGFELTPSAISHTATNETGLSGIPSKGPATTDVTTTTDTATSEDHKEQNRAREKGVNVAVKVARKKAKPDKCALVVIAVQIILILILSVIGVILYLNYDDVRTTLLTNNSAYTHTGLP